MRNKRTNILQFFVMIAGMYYILIGAAFFLSQTLLARIISGRVATDSGSFFYSDQFLYIVYNFSPLFALLVFITGLSMIMPLFEPLKYRGVIYCNGVFFQLFAGIYLLYAGVSRKYTVVTIFSLTFILLFLLTYFSLQITKKDAKAGIE